MSVQLLEIRAPEEQAEGTRSQVLRWLKAVGEGVSAHEPLIELETDKVTVEVAAPADGVLEQIITAEREEVAPGALLGRIRPAAAEPETQAGGAHPVEHAVAAPAAPRPLAPAGETDAVAQRHLAPAVHRLLTERGLDPNQVHGTGEGGRITVDDVLRHAPSRSVPVSPGRDAAEPSGGGDAILATRRVPHTAVRKRIAARMVESLLHTAPHVTTVFDIDLTAVLAHRAKHREQFARRGVALTLSAYFVRAAVEAISVVPEANSRWSEEALEIYTSVNLGIGTAAPEGLLAPVLRGAEALDLEQTARGIETLVRRAREGSLTPQDVRGGTFTMSNHGVSGSLLATPIILYPGQAAILGVGKVEKRAIVVSNGEEDRIEIRPRCYATLTIDHRVMDAERANRFMQVFAERLAGWGG